MKHLVPFKLHESVADFVHYPISVEFRKLGVTNFMGYYDPATQTAYPCLIEIHPSCKGKGTGRLLIEDFERWAKEQGALKIRSGYGAWGSATGFWSKLGYKIAKRKNKEGAYNFVKEL